MPVIPRLRALFRNWLRHRQVERDLRDELQAYAELVADEHRQRGMAADDAARRGRVALGSVASVAQAVRDGRPGAGVERVVQDVRYAFRSLRRAPGFAAIAVLTLGLGIGTTTTIFGVADAALFKPLPYRDPDRLVEIAYVLDRGTPTERRMMGLNGWPQLDRWRAEGAIFEGIALVGHAHPLKEVAGSYGATRFVAAIAPDVLALLGVSPVLGRPFSEADLNAGASPVLLAHDFWTRELNAWRDAIGTTISLDGVRHQIVGVMPPTFRWGVDGDRVVGWTLLDERRERAAGGRKAVGEVVRLREGLTVDAANREIRAAAARLQGDVPATDRWDIEIHPLDSRGVRLGDLRLVLLVFLGASGCLLLVPCANIASLLLARGLERRGELAIRSALGATRGRLLRQLITEGFVLSALSGVVGLLVAWGSVTAIPRLIPPTLPLFAANPLAIDARVLGFCLAAAALATLFCSLIPALRHSRHQVADLARGGTRATGEPSLNVLQRLLQSAQVTLVLVLLAAQTLLASSFIRMVTVDPGYDIDGLTGVVVTVPDDRYPGPAAAAFFDDLMARVRGLPGVQAATFGPSPAGVFTSDVEVTDRPGVRLPVHVVHAAPDYLDVVGIPLKAGRAFSTGDQQAPVTVISESLARTAWPGESPLGRQVKLFGSPWMTVIGVAGDTQPARLRTGTLQTFQVYLPITQDEYGLYSATRSLMVRSATVPEDLARQVAMLVRTEEPRTQLTSTGAVADDYTFYRQTPRLYLMLMTTMAALALATAVVGLYASTSLAVSRRRREIGIRLALGADAGRVRRAVLRTALQPVAIGTACGLVAAVWLTELLGTLLYGVEPGDPWMMAAAVTMLVTATAAGAWVPAHRASRIDPATTLRTE